MKRLLVVLFIVVAAVPAARADGMDVVQRMADQGNAEAQFMLGTLHRYGQGVDRDIPATLRLWKRAAQSGYVDALFALGDAYAGGNDVDRDLVQSYMWFDILSVRAKGRMLEVVAESNKTAVGFLMTNAEIGDALVRSAAWQQKHPGN